MTSSPLRVTLALSLALAAAGCSGAARSVPDDVYDRPAKITIIIGQAGRISVDDRGLGGMPVLFVHGNGSDKSVWDAQLAHLSGKRRVVALDLRGFGRSDLRDGAGLGVPAFASDIDAVANALKLDRFVLVGHSFGGAVVTSYAGTHPDRVAGVLYVDPAGDLSRTPREKLQGWLDNVDKDTDYTYSVQWFHQILEGAAPGVGEKVLASLQASRHAAFAGAIHGLVDYDPVPDLQAFHGPRLTVIRESNDTPSSLQNLVPDLPAEKVTGTSHWLMMDKPQELNRILDEFLARVGSGDGA